MDAADEMGETAENPSNSFLRRIRRHGAGCHMILRITFAISFFAFCSVSSTRVLLSLYALELGAKASTVGALTATFYLFPLILSWPIGRWADQFGARWLLLGGSACGLAGMLLAFGLGGLLALFVAAGLTGLAFAFYLVTLQNLIGVLSPADQRARNFSMFSVIGAVTNFVGPLVAGISIDHLGHASTTLVVAVLPLCSGIMLLLLGGRLPPGSGRAPAARGSLLALVRDRGMLRMLLTSSLVQLGTDLYQFYIPIYGHGLGLSASSIGAVLATFAAASFLVRFGLHHLLARYGEERVLSSAFVLGALGFLMVPFCGGAIALALSGAVFGLGMACGQPITTNLMFSRSVAGRSGELLGCG